MAAGKTLYAKEDRRPVHFRRGAGVDIPFLVLVLVFHTTRQEKRACIQKLFGKK